MKFIYNYKLFESKIDTDNIIKNTLSNLPDGFFYRIKSFVKGTNDRNISDAIDEYAELTITFAKLDDDNGKVWSVDKKEIPHKKYIPFKLNEIDSNIQELLGNLNDYSVVNGKYMGFIANNYTHVSNPESMLKNNSNFIKLAITLRSDIIPSFRSTKSENDNEIRDIFIGVLDGTDSEINIKQSKKFIKIMNLYKNNSPYDQAPISEKKELIEAISRTENALDMILISASFSFRDYSSKLKNSDREFNISKKTFNKVNKDIISEFILNNEVTEFTLIFKES